MHEDESAGMAIALLGGGCGAAARFGETRLANHDAGRLQHPPRRQRPNRKADLSTPTRTPMIRNGNGVEAGPAHRFAVGKSAPRATAPPS